jgi:hypothetical protein
MEKFHFNPLPLRKEIREFFPNLQTLFVYSPEDELFEDDERIIARKKLYIHESILREEQNQLEQWTGKKCNEVIFDSDKDNWSQNTSVFDDRVKGKSNLMFVIEDTNNNKFGSYITASIKTTANNEQDSNAFLFSLKSNGRVNGMYKFEIKSNGAPRACYLYNKSDGCMFGFGDAGCFNMWIYKENSKGNSGCKPIDSYYDFHGTSEAFLPNCKQGSSDIKFTPKRFVVIQMKQF